MDQLTLNFKTRDEYHVWRTEWRTQYRALSLKIRANKMKAAELAKTGHHSGTTQSILKRQQAQANAMMELRTESKLLAGQQSAERPALVAAA